MGGIDTVIVVRSAHTGHDPQGRYVETFWLPVVGPTAVVLLRSLDRTLGQRQTVRLPARELAASVGVGHDGGMHSPLMRSVRRLGQFGLGQWREDRLVLGYGVPSLATRHVTRLPLALQVLHGIELEASRVA
jgi:hypothetical protein